MGLKENLKRLRQEAELTQAALAEKAHVPQSIISEIETGRRHSTGSLPEIAKALGCDVGELDARFATNGRENYRAPPELFGQADLPVYAAVEAGPGEMVVTTDPIDLVVRPWYLKAVKDGFAVLVIGDSMEPVLRAGHLAIVNPRLPPIREQEAIFISEEHTGEFRASIKRFLRATESHWHVQQFNPPRGQKHDLAYPRSLWTKAYRVVGVYYGG